MIEKLWLAVYLAATLTVSLALSDAVGGLRTRVEQWVSG